MQRLLLCSVFDAKAEAFMQPVFVQAKGQAIRSFSDAINDASTNFGKHPEDYTLFVVGEWDELDGTLYPAPAPECIVTGISLLTGDNPQ